MIQTILYVDKRLTIEDICQMNHLEFMKKYESCMNLIGKQPVVTVTSGKGMLDYKQIADTIYEAYTNLTNHGN